MDATIFNVVNNHITTIWGLLFYWLPLVFCVFGYIVRTAENVQLDLTAREEAESDGKPELYKPTDTIGTLIGRALVSILPVANILAACFDIGPRIFGKFFKFLGQIFDQPLVPRKR